MLGSDKVVPFPKGFFTDCEPASSEGICAQGKLSFKLATLLGNAGTCIPSSAQVFFCSKELDNCICPIQKFPDKRDERNCQWQWSIIDIYIINNTDQKLHLVSKGADINLKINDTSDEVSEEITFLRDPSIPPPFMVGWISPPPNTIDICETVLIRGSASCILNCCRSDVTLQIDIAYDIGVGDTVPRLNFSTCRNKPKGFKDPCFGDFVTDCQIPFKAVEFCGTPTINPTTSIYSVVPRTSASQAVLSIVGGSIGCTGTTPVGCTGDKGCPDNERCVDFKCVSRTGTTGCNSNLDCPGKEICRSGICVKSTDDNKQFIILVSVSVVVVIVVFGFLFFLVSLRRSKKSK